MRIHYLQHVAFEGLGCLADYFNTQAFTLSATHLYQDETLPSVETFDMLIVLGGPMGVHDEAEFPWLTAEKELIKSAIENKKIVLGICLGAQLIANVLGAKVYKNAHKEIGWWPIATHPHIQKTALSSVFSTNQEVFHWHGDTFDLPHGAIPIASSNACKNQGFMYKDHVIALQFHLETTLATAQALIEHCAGDLEDSAWVQNADTMTKDQKRFEAINAQMALLLNAMFKTG
ncbi:MAG TPA: type 1 glutamine amidotransferase [Pseudomonadales bacterium]|nr:type 1 glutamine amidotransferase [Pseudomonadales bacterium]